MVALLISLIPTVCYGTIGVFAAKLARAMGAFQSGTLIQMVGFVLTLLIWPLFFTRLDNIIWVGIISVGVVSALVYYLFCKALEIGSVTLVSPITSSWSLITAVLGILFLQESAGIIKILSIILVIIGVIILSINWKAIKNKQFLSTGVSYAILVALGWGVVYFYAGPLTRQMGWFNTTLGIRLFVAITLGLVFIFKKGSKKQMKFKKIPWIYVGIIGILDVIAFTVYNLAVSKYEVSYVSVISSASPLITVVLASLILKETTNRIHKIGIVTTIIGIIGLQL